MRWTRTSRAHAAIGIALGTLIVLGWVRREAYIAETPSVPPVVIPNEVEESRSIITGSLPPPRNATEGRSDSARDDAPSQQFVIRHSSFVIPNVPFVSQAPFRVWGLPYKEFCEEASVLTVHYWKQGRRTPPADQLDRELKEVQQWEEVHLGKWEDTTVEETARVLRERFGYASTRVVRDITVEDIQRELDAGRPVIVPAAGRELSSPYYRPPGPLYHMLVIIGYDKAKREFITNDVGTNTKGAGFRFTEDDLHGAIGDWDAEHQKPDTSQKVMIVIE